MFWSVEYKSDRIQVFFNNDYRGDYQLITDLSCDLCSYPLGKDGNCIRSQSHSSNIAKGYTVGLYRDTTIYHESEESDLLSRHIYNAKIYYLQAEPLGLAMAELIQKRDRELLKFDLLAPVPQFSTEIHHDRKTGHAFNQAAEIAKPVSRVVKIPMSEEALEKTRSQSMQGNLAERNEAVVALYRANPRIVKGKRILVIDDVSTSGNTERACADALTENGAKEVRTYVCGINAL